MYDVWRANFGINLQSTSDMGQNGSEFTEFGRNYLNFETILKLKSVELFDASGQIKS